MSAGVRPGSAGKQDERMQPLIHKSEGLGENRRKEEAAGDCTPAAVDQAVFIQGLESRFPV